MPKTYCLRLIQFARELKYLVLPREDVCSRSPLQSDVQVQARLLQPENKDDGCHQQRNDRRMVGLVIAIY